MEKKLNKILTFGIFVVLILLTINVVSYIEYKSSLKKIDLLEEENRVSLDSIEKYKLEKIEYGIILGKELHKKDSIRKIALKYEIILHVLNKELIEIKGRYKKISNDSLRNLLIKDYENDLDTIISK